MGLGPRASGLGCWERALKPRPFQSVAIGAAVTILSLTVSGPVVAAEYYAAPDGSATGQGTKAAPWDLSSALGGGKKIGAGDTLWLTKGTYKAPFRPPGLGFEVKLEGRDGAPVVVRGVPGERVTIDGGLLVQEPSTYLWIRDLEILVSEPRPEKAVSAGSSPADLKRPHGGLNIYSGVGCRFINLVIHDNNQGVSWWSGSRDSELHGCIIYDNGWLGTDRGHGHAIYTQNREGVKTISDCIMTGGFAYSLHAYGSERADVDEYLAVGNIVYNAGQFLIGGGKPSRGIRVLDNLLYSSDMRLGYSAPHNEDCEVRRNWIVNGGLSIQKFRRAETEANVIVAAEAPRPPARIVLRPNRYDPKRAHLAVFNPEKKAAVSVDGDTFLKKGDRFRLMDPRDFYGKPVVSGAYDGKAIQIPMRGEFAAFVLLK
jgi:hypothetical protein